MYSNSFHFFFVAMLIFSLPFIAAAAGDTAVDTVAAAVVHFQLAMIFFSTHTVVVV